MKLSGITCDYAIYCLNWYVHNYAMIMMLSELMWEGLDYVRSDIWSKIEQQVKVLYVLLFLWRTKIALLHVRVVGSSCIH